MAFGHRVGVREVKHPGIAAGMHGLRKDKSAELAGIRRPANDNPRLVRLTVRGSRNEVLPGNVVEVRQVVSRLEFHQCLKKLSRPGDFPRDCGDGRNYRRRILRLRGLSDPPLPALSALALRPTLPAAPLDRDWQLSWSRNHGNHYHSGD